MMYVCLCVFMLQVRYNNLELVTSIPAQTDHCHINTREYGYSLASVLRRSMLKQQTLIVRCVN